MADINKNNCTTIFHERIKPFLDVYEEDLESFGRIMYNLFKYSIYEEENTLDDKRDNALLKSLCNAIDLAREGSRSHRVDQTIKANLRYAKDEEDMKRRLEMKDLTEEEVQQGLDRYKAKEEKEMGVKLTSDGQFPKGTSFDIANAYNNSR